MRKFKFAKLIRSKIVSTITSMGGVAHTRTLSHTDYKKEILEQLKGETEELENATPEDAIEEMADVYEALETLRKTMNISTDQISTQRQKKTAKFGDFQDPNSYVEYVEVPNDYPWIDYYLKNSDRYPEITNDRHTEALPACAGREV